MKSCRKGFGCDRTIRRERKVHGAGRGDSRDAPHAERRGPALLLAVEGSDDPLRRRHRARRRLASRSRRGAICGLIGPNGAGKTTLFNCISRLYDPHAGSIRFDGRPLPSVPRHAIAALGIARTFQNLALFATMTRARQRLRRARMRWRAAGSSPTRSRCRSARARGEANRRARRRADRGIRPRRGRATVRSANCRSAYASGSSSPARSPSSRSSCCSTNPPRGLNHEEVDALARRNPRHPRPARRRGAPGRTSHEPRHARLRPGRRARFRPDASPTARPTRCRREPEVVRAYLGSAH